MTIVITGAAGAVGGRVVHRLVRDRPGLDVRAVDKVAVGSRPGLEVKQVDLASDDLGAVFSGART
ncbi:MAG: hypothetical protein L7U56_00155, partial [Acidimicrobiales bacterium]|nr:hypothetical protein [Acidimicrobiales bacterium]